MQRFYFLGVILFLFISGCAGKHVQTASSSAERVEVCWNQIASNSDSPAVLEEHIDAQIVLFQVYAEQLLVSSEESINLIEQARSGLVPDKPIAPAIMEKIQVKMTDDLALVEPISFILAENTCWLEATPEELNSRGLSSLNKATRVKGIMLEIAASSLLYDLYLNVVAAVNEVDRLRRFANQRDPGYGLEANKIREVSTRFSSIHNLSAMKSLVEKYDARQDEVTTYRQQDDEIAYLDILIRTSVTFRAFQDMPKEHLISHRQSARSRTLHDSLLLINQFVVGNLSASFGNLVGRVEERKGKLYNDQDIEAYLATILRPGDILLEKTPFRLTDRLIPGYWGHAAIWVGDPATLKRLGLWQTPLVKPYQERLASGHLIAEALREGTILNSLAHFLNIDDLAILRRTNLTDDELRMVLTRTFRQIGKPYDFNFDVETTDKIVCSQLIYLAYPNSGWPTKAIAGRYTISPDNIAAQALNNDSFKIVTLIADGAFVLSNKSAAMVSLINQDVVGQQYELDRQQ